MNTMRFRVLVGFVALCTAASMLLSSCGDSTGPDEPQQQSALIVPGHFPAVPFPQDNPYNEAKATLGKKLYYDGRLSKDGSVSCGTCHKQELAFTDGLPVARGINGELGSRNTPTVVNTAYLRELSFDGLSPSLEVQLLRALRNPVEMQADTAVVSQFLNSDATYRSMFAAAFGADAPVNTEYAMRALATFVRTVLSGSSRYDRYLLGDNSALNEQEKRGRSLFFNTRTRCALCHASYDFTDGIYHNTGLYMHYIDKGRYYATKDDDDIGKFKTPSLRNIALTAPYMHDGSLNTLEEVVAHYDRGGHPTMQRDTLMRPLNLTPQETADIISFMKTLTDDNLLRDSRFAK